jgi:hypothetical protein
MGGTSDPRINAWANLILMCGTGTSAGGCHARTEHNPTWALEHGYRVGSWDDPATVPVTHYQYGRALN